MFTNSERSRLLGRNLSSYELVLASLRVYQDIWPYYTTKHTRPGTPGVKFAGWQLYQAGYASATMTTHLFWLHVDRTIPFAEIVIHDFDDVRDERCTLDLLIERLRAHELAYREHIHDFAQYQGRGYW